MKGHKGGTTPHSFYPDNHELVLLGHELGNVLNGLLGMAELLHDSGLTSEQDRWLRAIEHSGRQMQSLIQAVDFPMTGSGQKRAPSNRRIDGLDLLEQVVTSHTPAARLRSNHLMLVVDPGLPRHWNCDSCLIRQLLDNLLGNAIKFTRAGEVVLEATANTGTGTEGKVLELRISDTGKGLGGIIGKRIFEAYQRARPSGGDRLGDRGLGLFVCRNIVLSLNGRITGSSPGGGGACFEIALPEALIFKTIQPPVARSSLLTHIRCQLKLGNPIRRSVGNFLDRLGVGWSDDNGSSVMEDSGRILVLVISDTATLADGHPPGLLVCARFKNRSVLHNRILDAPVLQSSLGVLLLDFALQWSRLAIRNETPGSTPTPRRSKPTGCRGPRQG